MWNGVFNYSMWNVVGDTSIVTLSFKKVDGPWGFSNSQSPILI